MADLLSTLCDVDNLPNMRPASGDIKFTTQNEE